VTKPSPDVCLKHVVDADKKYVDGFAHSSAAKIFGGPSSATDGVARSAIG